MTAHLMPTAWRFHTEPSLTTAMSNKYGNLNIETKLYATHYNQKKGSSSAAEEIQKSVNRVLPQLKVDLQTVLASNQTLLMAIHKRLNRTHNTYIDHIRIKAILALS